MKLLPAVLTTLCIALAPAGAWAAKAQPHATGKHKVVKKAKKHTKAKVPHKKTA